MRVEFMYGPYDGRLMEIPDGTVNFTVTEHRDIAWLKWKERKFHYRAASVDLLYSLKPIRMFPNNRPEDWAWETFNALDALDGKP